MPRLWLVHRSRNAIKHSPVGADNGGGGFGPFEGCRVAVPVAHIGGDVVAQRAFGGEVSGTQDCFPRIPKKPSTWLSQEALVGV